MRQTISEPTFGVHHYARIKRRLRTGFNLGG
jgi:hypothetical protein